MEFYVNGMACGGCANKVQTAIESVGKIHKANVDYTTGKVVVEAGAVTPVPQYVALPYHYGKSGEAYRYGYAWIYPPVPASE